MALFNCYVRCAEAETKELLPQEYAQQAQLRTLLNRHPVFRQHCGLGPWFAACTDESYVGCVLESEIFTNTYIEGLRRESGEGAAEVAESRRRERRRRGGHRQDARKELKKSVSVLHVARSWRLPLKPDSGRKRTHLGGDGVRV